MHRLESVMKVWLLVFCQVSSGDRSALWALLTFYGGDCQLTLNKKCTHLVVPEPKGVSISYASLFYMSFKYFQSSNIFFEVFKNY